VALALVVVGSDLFTNGCGLHVDLPLFERRSMHLPECPYERLAVAAAGNT
jgi:hypothetical protein